MKKSFWSSLGIVGPLLANFIGGKAAELVGAGLAMAGVAQAMAARVFPEFAGVITAAGFLTGVVLNYFLGNRQAQMIANMAEAGLTAVGPVLLNGVNANREMEAYQQGMTLENYR